MNYTSNCYNGNYPHSKNNMLVCLLTYEMLIGVLFVICCLFVTFGLGVCTVDCSNLFTIDSTLIKHTPINWKLNFVKGTIKTNK